MQNFLKSKFLKIEKSRTQYSISHENNNKITRFFQNWSFFVYEYIKISKNAKFSEAKIP